MEDYISSQAKGKEIKKKEKDQQLSKKYSG